MLINCVKFVVGPFLNENYFSVFFFINELSNNSGLVVYTQTLTEKLWNFLEIKTAKLNL